VRDYRLDHVALAISALLSLIDDYLCYGDLSQVTPDMEAKQLANDKVRQ
jgi:hypothetical protein